MKPDKTRNWQRYAERFKLMAAALPALLLAVAIVLRAGVVERAVGSYTACEHCYFLPTLGNDAWLLALVLAILALSCVIASRTLRVVLRLLSATLVLVVCADLVLLDLLTQRLHLDDVLRIGGALTANWSVVQATLASPAGIAKAVAAVLVLVALLISCTTVPRQPRLGVAFAALCLVALSFAAYAHSQPLRFVHAVFINNVIVNNLPQGRLGSYSAPFIAAAREKVAALPHTCEQREGSRRPDVIVLLVESLSSWHSALLGSDRDWTPRLDALARDNHYLSRFYANGYSTSGAEIAVATGHVPFNPPGRTEFSFDNYRMREGTLPTMARAAGYRSLFFTPGDTSFLGLGGWLRNLGFDQVDGSDDAAYTNQRRWQFGAVEDKSFYERFLAWLDSRDRSQRFAALLLTVTSHPPFVNPRDGRVDPEGTFRYVDEQIGRFDSALRERGFYQNGVLVVMGDHRTMTPLHRNEFEFFGERAFARVPLVVIGDIDMPAVVDAPFQQTDLVPSMT
ncbi:MAG: LTA synthase family protein, partial [Dokdonella sp.]